ncbi:hypothetical protein ABTX35_17695 [Streptomyces sp. NPDC096080]|uniref:hypothetical protein n=1 Tax=Streptomyces sp. NPDC096080 TaxID=3156693 RepID=UPI00331D62EF
MTLDAWPRTIRTCSTLAPTGDGYGGAEAPQAVSDQVRQLDDFAALTLGRLALLTREQPLLDVPRGA